MTDARWGEVVALFERALEWPEEERWRRLADATDGDRDLERRVSAMLRADGAGHRLIDAPPGSVQAWALGSLEAPSFVGRRFGPYTILREIGRGGMGAVYLAERTDVEMRVALKVVPGLASQELLDRFLLERQVLAQLDHARIARLLDVGVTDDGTPWLAMEYVDGRPIDRWCDARRLDLGERIALFERVCEAVGYAHRNLVVHRDLKPANILVTGDGEPRLVDFGIAKLLDGSAAPATLTRAGAAPLTPRYASPEQLTGGPVTTATDVYQLGLLLYELLTGRHPHPPREPRGSAAGAGHPPPPPPSRAVVEPGGAATRWGEGPPPETLAQLRRTTPRRLRLRLAGDLDAITLTALRPEPERRYPSALQLAEDLRRHRTGHPVTATPDSLAYRAGKFVRRNRVPVAAAAVVGLALLGGVAATTWQAERAAREARVAALERDRARTEAAKAERMVAFLTDLFQASDPGQALGREPTAREVLDDGARRLLEGDSGEPLADEPEVRADLLHTLGSVYLNLGLHESARPLLEESLALRRAHLKDDDPELAESLAGMGALAFATDRLEPARRHFEEALSIHRRADGPASAGAALHLHNFALVELREGDLRRAEGLLREALAIHRELPDEEWERRGGTLAALAGVLSRSGRPAAADSFHLEALALQRERRPPGHPELGRALNSVGVSRQRAGDPAAAEPYLREALEIWREVLGVHPDVAVALNNLGSALEAQGKVDEAETAYRESLTMKRELVRGDHVSVTYSLNNLGLLLSRAGRFEEAEPLLEASLAMRRRLRGDDHPVVARAYHNLGDLHDRRGDNARAVRLYRRALEIRRERLEPGHRLTLESAVGLADALREEGDRGEAEELLAWVEQAGGDVLAVDTAVAARFRRVRQALAPEGVLEAAARVPR